MDIWHSISGTHHQWPSVAISVNPCPSVAPSGTQWHSVALSGTRLRRGDQDHKLLELQLGRSVHRALDAIHHAHVGAR